MRAKFFSALLCVVAATSGLIAQSPTPIVVQAVTPGAPPRVAQTAPAAAESSASTLKLLQELKAANDAILAKQAATLQQLEELEKAAEQIKIYSKRG